MKITANRREDIEKQMAEYDAETKKLKTAQQEKEDEYRRILYNQQKALEARVAEIIGSTSLELEIRVDPYGRSFSDNGKWSIEVKANESKKFDDNVALSWSWEIGVDRQGNIVKDSGSWSGMKITTPEQVADLEESVRIIKLLNNTDWGEVLNAPKADFSDYYDTELNQKFRDRQKNRPNFEGDLEAATIDDLIGGNTALKLSDDAYWRGNVWILPTGYTDKFIKGYIFPQYYVKDGVTADELREKIGEERRTSRNKLVRHDGKLATMEI